MRHRVSDTDYSRCPREFLPHAEGTQRAQKTPHGYSSRSTRIKLCETLRSLCVRHRVSDTAYSRCPREFLPHAEGTQRAQRAPLGYSSRSARIKLCKTLRSLCVRHRVSDTGRSRSPRECWPHAEGTQRAQRAPLGYSSRSARIKLCETLRSLCVRHRVSDTGRSRSPRECWPHAEGTQRAQRAPLGYSSRSARIKLCETLRSLCVRHRVSDTGRSRSPRECWPHAEGTQRAQRAPLGYSSRSARKKLCETLRSLCVRNQVSSSGYFTDTFFCLFDGFLVNLQN